MGETSDQIERHIQETRNDLGDNFSELEEKVKTAVDWRAQFEERPMTMIGLAFGGGLLLSALLPSGRSSRRRYAQRRRTAPPNLDASGLSINSNTVFDKTTSRASDWNTLKSALVGVAATKLTGFIDDLIPGFKEEFTKAKTHRRFDTSDSSTSAQPTWQKSTAAGAH